MRYLSLSKKRPENRGDYSHNEVLVKLGEGLGSKDLFYKKLRYAATKVLQVEETGLDEALWGGGQGSWRDAELVLWQMQDEDS